MSDKKKITLIISGGIAAYKICQLVSDLTKKGYIITCVLTKAACEFVAPLTFKTLSKNPVYTDLFLDSDYYDGVLHIDLAQKTDLIVVAPATANIIAKYSNGISDDLATSILVASNKPVMMFPAMNDVMYSNFQNTKNMKELKKNKVMIFEPDEGLMACGTIGKGRLPSQDTIMSLILRELNEKKDLLGKKILINAGGTKEKIDPARCISNYSSGKMGLALAENAYLRGGEVFLIMANHSVRVPDYINTLYVEDTKEMKNEMEKKYDENDVIIFCAAVSDFVPFEVSKEKIKKKEQLDIKLIKNIDIAMYFKEKKTSDKTHIGFSLETDNLEYNAKVKMNKKGFDYIVSNSNKALNADKNSGMIISKNNHKEDISLESKDKMANDIYDFINIEEIGE